MIKRTSEKSIDNRESMKYVMSVARGQKVTIGNGKKEWTLKGAYLSLVGGYSKDRGVYPSAIARLEYRKGNQVDIREAHLHTLKLVQE